MCSAATPAPPEVADCQFNLPPMLFGANMAIHDVDLFLTTGFEMPT
jgi:hypothetical protein